MRAGAKRQIYEEREAKKKVQKETNNRAPTSPVQTVRTWDAPMIKPLVPRPCPYRMKPNHWAISCPMCEGYPID